MERLIRQGHLTGKLVGPVFIGDLKDERMVLLKHRIFHGEMRYYRGRRFSVLLCQPYT